MNVKKKTEEIARKINCALSLGANCFTCDLSEDCKIKKEYLRLKIKELKYEVKKNKMIN